MDQERAELLRRRIELYRGTLRAGIRGEVAIEYLRQIESDETELARLRQSEDTGLTSRGLAADERPVRSLRKYVAELVDQFDALAVSDPRRGAVAARIRRIEAEIARRRKIAAEPPPASSP
jgi:hypothetical protein